LAITFFILRYVLQLAIADSLFLLTLPFKVNEDISQQWIYPDWMCKAKESILFLTYYASILFLVVSLFAVNDRIHNNMNAWQIQLKMQSYW